MKHLEKIRNELVKFYSDLFKKNYRERGYTKMSDEFSVVLEESFNAGFDKGAQAVMVEADKLVAALDKYKRISAPMGLQNWPNDVHHFYADESIKQWQQLVNPEAERVE